MTIKCTNTVAVPPEKIKKYDWTPTTRSTLADLADKRAKALEAQAAMYAPVDPIAARSRQISQRSQQYWEQMVWETGKIAFLTPQQSARASQWLANWMGVKVGLAGDVRNPLLNVKRLADGMAREMGVYGMMVKQRELAGELKSIAKQRGVTVRPDDMRRILEEGMTPQRLSVYGNSPTQTAALNDRYQQFVADFTQRGFTPDDIEDLVKAAAGVSSQWDEFQAVARAVGVESGNLFNIGFMPRQLTEDGFSQAKLAGAINLGDTRESAGVALAKSRATWRYLPEDHGMASAMLGITPDELHGFIASPVDFAMFLSKRVTEEQLNLLVDSGIMSKIPMLTNEVGEFLARTYKLPLGATELFIADPMEATQQLTKRLQRGLEQSAMVKLINSEGLKQGWAIPTELLEIDPQQFPGFVKLSDIQGLGVGTDRLYVHPVVGNQLQAIVDISKSPAEMNNAGRAWAAYTNWFAKEAIGNPVGAKVYLFNQFMSNMLSTYGRGVSIAEYWMSVVDMTKLAMRGTSAFDNVKPFRVIDGKTVTHQELVAMTARMFSRDILPGMSGADALIKWGELNPAYTAKQVLQLRASAETSVELAGELGRVLNRKRDAILLPTIRLAAILDMAGHLAVARGKTQKLGGLNQAVDAVGQLVLGGGIGKHAAWADVVDDIKQGFPTFDDAGKIPAFLSKVFPFSSWAMQNLPLQLADMRRNPSRWYAYGRIHALWNDSQVEDDDTIARGEMTQAELDEYGIILSRDANDAKTVMLMTNNFDPRWGVVTWMAKLLDQSPNAKKLRDSVDGNPVADWMTETMGKSYFAGFYKALSGIDPYTKQRRDDSQYGPGQTFLGVSMPGWMANVLSISPVLSSVDRLETISGTRPALDPRTGAILIPAVQGWLGNKGKLPPKRLEGIEATIQTMGAKVRYIDGLTNMQYTEADTVKAISDIIARQKREQTNLAAEVKAGTVSRDSPEYARRVGMIHQMTDATIQMNYDLGRIQLWAIKKKLPSTTTLGEMKKKGLVLDNLPLPGAEYIKEQLDKALSEKGEL